MSFYRKTQERMIKMLENYGDVITPKDLCKILRIGTNTAYLILQNKTIPSIRIGNKYIIPKASVINFLNDCLKSA